MSRRKISPYILAELAEADEELDRQLAAIDRGLRNRQLDLIAEAKTEEEVDLASEWPDRKGK
jgi:hypothetical protein